LVLDVAQLDRAVTVQFSVSSRGCVKAGGTHCTH